MKIIVVGTHEYQWALFPFWHLLRKHWGERDVTWYGDRVEGPLPDGLSFERVPCYTQGVWPWEHWFGNGLMSILREIEDDHALIFLPDHWFIEPVRDDGVREMLAYMRENPDVVRGNVTAGTCLDGFGELVEERGGFRVVQAHPGSPSCSIFGGMAGAPALWSRTALLALLEPHWSLWGMEILGTQKMARLWPRWRSVGILPAPVRRAHALSHQEPDAVRLKGMEPEDRETVRGMLPDGYKIVE